MLRALVVIFVASCYSTPVIEPCTMTCDPAAKERCPDGTFCRTTSLSSLGYCLEPDNNEACPAPTFTITVAKTGASADDVVQGDGFDGLDCGTDCDVDVEPGAHMLVAKPGSESRVVDWMIDGESIPDCANAGQCLIPIVDRDVTVVTSFAAGRTLTVSLVGEGSGTVRVPGQATPCTLADGSCSYGFDLGASVPVTALAASPTAFIGWSGACTQEPCTVTLDANKSVTARFDVTRMTLVPVTPSVGRLDTLGLMCSTFTCDVFLDPSQGPVTVSAVVSDGFYVETWATVSTCDAAQPPNNFTCSVPVANDIVVVAVFDQQPEVTITPPTDGFVDVTGTSNQGTKTFRCDKVLAGPTGQCRARFFPNTQVRLSYVNDPGIDPPFVITAWRTCPTMGDENTNECSFLMVKDQDVFVQPSIQQL